MRSSREQLIMTSWRIIFPTHVTLVKFMWEIKEYDFRTASNGITYKGNHKNSFVHFELCARLISDCDEKLANTCVGLIN
jgi:hypothetical protein